VPFSRFTSDHRRPARLESDESGKALRPWIEILHDGESVRSTAEFRKLLRDL
jgi:hypothetical protein